MKNIFLIIFFLKLNFIVAQNGKDTYFPPAPEASALIKYVDVPVNYSTGVTNYSLPVHIIKLKNLAIPIILTYTTSGLKPSEIAGNTGLGWELNAGGKITQNVIKQNDVDSYGPANKNTWNLPNDRDFKLPLPVPDLYLGTNPYQGKLDSLRADGTDYAKFFDTEQSNLDTQPDLFYYSTPNKSGKFFFGNNYEVKQIPFGKEKIIYNTSNRTFEIIDTEGVRYLYNIVTENINFTESVCLKFPTLNGTATGSSNTFYLAQIITPDNEIVDFIYDTVKYNLVNDKDYSRYYHWFFGGGEKVTSYFSQITTKVLTKIKVNQDYEIDFVYTKYRKDIKGTVQATAPKTLDAIKINYKNVTNTYNFDYGYFGIPEGAYNPSLFESTILNEDTAYRLKLKSFQKVGENPYIFSYFDEQGVSRYSTCMDHWGYYSANCGKYTINTLFNDLGSQKEPNLQTSRTNILKAVILPTKGEIEFNYELNTCSDCPITYTTYDWTSISAYANDDDNFSGAWVSRVMPFTVPENSITSPYAEFNLYNIGGNTTTNYAVAELYEVINGEDHLMDIQFMGTIGDNWKPLQVDALQMGKNYKLVLWCYDTIENENKYVMINFLNATTHKSTTSSVGGLRIANIKTKDVNNLTSDRSFNYNDSSHSSGILYEKPFYYDEYSSFNEVTDPRAVGNTMETGLISYAVQHSRIPSDLFGFTGYHIFYKKVTESSNDVKDESNTIKTEKYFTFHDDIKYGEQTYFSKISYNWKRGLPSVINEYNKNNIARKTKFSYRFLDTPPGTISSKNDTGFPLWNPTFPNEFHQRSINISVYRRNVNFYNIYLYASSKLISAWYYMDKKTTEEYFNGEILKTEENFKYDNPVSAQLTSHSTTNSKGVVLETKYYYPDDLSGQPLMAELKASNRISIPIVTEQYKQDQNKVNELISKNITVYAKDPTTSHLLLPKEIYFAKFPNSLPSLANGIGTLERKITYNQYDDKGNILQYTPEGGSPVSIIWGYNKTLPIAKVENVAYYSILAGTITNLQSLSNADNDNCLSGSCTEQVLRSALNAFRDTFPNAFITTYTYNPVVGVTSVTDPKTLSSYYEYDTSGRLKFVKDKDLNVLQKYCYNYKGQQINCSDNSSTSVVYYKSIPRSGSFTKNNCVTGGVGSSVSFSQALGACTSSISQAYADAVGLAKFNADGLDNANANGTCTFSSISRVGSFTKNNCASDGIGSNVSYSQAVGASTSTNSQTDADAIGLAKFNTDGQAYANTNGICTFYNVVKSGTFTRNNCSAGGTGSSITYTVAARTYNSTDSQAAADALAQTAVNNNGQAYANTNGICTFYNVVKSGTFTRNNCAAGGTSSSVTYTVAARTYNSIDSQAAVDAIAQTAVNNNGQAYANTNGICTFYSSEMSYNFAKNDCPVGGSGSSFLYTQLARAAASTDSQSDANSKGFIKLGTDGQAYANAIGYCTFSSAALGAYFVKTNCPAGSINSPGSIYYGQSAGVVTSKISQADADARANAKFNVDGPAYVNSVGQCEYYSNPLSGAFTKNNCPAGTAGSSVLYSLGFGAARSMVSQAEADAAALNLFYFYGQAQANIGTCTFYSKLVVYQIYKNDYCPPGTTFPYVYYIVNWGAYQSNISQADADNKAWADVGENAQAYANANGRCLYLGEVDE